MSIENRDEASATMAEDEPLDMIRVRAMAPWMIRLRWWWRRRQPLLDAITDDLHARLLRRGLPPVSRDNVLEFLVTLDEYYTQSGGRPVRSAENWSDVPILYTFLEQAVCETLVRRGECVADWGSEYTRPPEMLQAVHGLIRR